MILFLVLFAVFAGVAAALWFHGLWNNLITLVNVIFSALIALNFYEPLAQLIVDQMPAYTQVVDFLMIWLLFAITFAIFRLITDFLSWERVEFQKYVELVGRGVSAAIVAWVFVAFTAMTVHTAPLQSTPFNGALMNERDGCFLAADQLWASFFHSCSAGSLHNGQVFDEGREYFVKHYHRRKSLEGQDSYLRN